MTSHCITWHDTTQAITSHQITWAHITSHRIASKQVTSPPWNSRRLVHSKDMVWASRWSVAWQILSLLYTSFFFWNFRPRLARELLVYAHVVQTLVKDRRAPRNRSELQRLTWSTCPTYGAGGFPGRFVGCGPFWGPGILCWGYIFWFHNMVSPKILETICKRLVWDKMYHVTPL